MKSIVLHLEQYYQGMFGTRESAEFVIRHIKDEADAKETLEAASKHPELIEVMKEIVKEFKDLTDEQWDKVLTLRIGSWVGTPEQLAKVREAQEIIDKNNNKLLRKGVSVLNGMGFINT